MCKDGTSALTECCARQRSSKLLCHAAQARVTLRSRAQICDSGLRGRTKDNTREVRSHKSSHPMTEVTAVYWGQPQDSRSNSSISSPCGHL